MNLKTLASRIEALENVSGAVPPVIVTIRGDEETGEQARASVLARYRQRDRSNICVVCMDKADAEC